MFHRIHQKLGTAGFIISIVALVAALSGGAYSASGGLNGKQKKEVEKIAKKYAGKPGANGAPGATGPAGAAGAAGAAGGKGDAGASGVEGKQGPEGKQGSEGKPGENGSPWTAVGTLPPGKTETGTWAIALTVPASAIAAPKAGISFSVPLAQTDAEVITVDALTKAESEEGREGGNPACPGTVNDPEAEPGHFCLYTSEFFGFVPLMNGIPRVALPGSPLGTTTTGVGTSGVIVGGTAEEGQRASGGGSWAVTAPN